MSELANLQERCKARYEECIAIACESFPLINFKLATITFSNRMTRCAGKYIKRGNVEEIRLSNKILMLNPEQFIYDTVAHETAHQVQRTVYGRAALPHGEEWQSIMRLFGLEPQTRHSMKVPGHLYVVDGKEFHMSTVRHNRLQKGTIYINSQNGQRFEIKKEHYVGEQR